MAHRNAIRAGMLDQRSRATTRRRAEATKSRAPGRSEVLSQLQAAIAGYIEPLDDDADALERIDWRRFLSLVDGIDAPPSEKLRHLAIAIENAAMSIRGPRGWLILARLYDAAAALDPEDDAVLHSAGFSALNCAPVQEPTTRDRLLAVARDRGRQAVALAPEDPANHHLLGRVAYDGACEDAQLEEALAHFDAALAVDGGHNKSRLFRAYTLHDLKRYSAAADAYAAVDLGQMTAEQAWLIEPLRDNLAHCLYRSGRTEAALEMWSEAIARIGRRRPDPYALQPRHLLDAARGPLRERLFSPLLAAARAVGDDELLEALLAADEHE